MNDYHKKRSYKIETQYYYDVFEDEAKLEYNLYVEGDEREEKWKYLGEFPNVEKCKEFAKNYSEKYKVEYFTA